MQNRHAVQEVGTAGGLVIPSVDADGSSSDSYTTAVQPSPSHFGPESPNEESQSDPSEKSLHEFLRRCNLLAKSR